MELKLIVAYIAGGASLISVLINVLLARSSERSRQKHDREMNDLQGKQETRLKLLEAQLTDVHSERDARRDYEYEARKRLYAEVEPVLFQLVELSEAALHRIYSLARMARLGNLDANPSSWLSDGSHYYYRSTLYHLMAPLAAVKLLQQRITFVDLTVEKSIVAQYALAKRLYFSFTDDFEFARCEPAISYDPNSNELTPEIRRAEPWKFWRQGVFIGWLENFAEAMLVEGTNGRATRVKSFGEFETAWNKAESSLAQAAKNIEYLLLYFHPQKRPVLWRTLVVQSCIYAAFFNIRENKLRGIAPSEKPLTGIPRSKRGDFDWRGDPTEVSAKEALEAPFSVAEHYLEKHLSEFWAR